VIAGERRCGTTTLADILASHSQICVHKKRDSGFFVDLHIRKGGKVADWDATNSIASYEKFFANTHRGGKRLLAEKSADYLYFKPAHERIARFLPHAKFVFVLRDPVARAWSHYWNEVGKGRERLGFAEAIRAESGRVSKNDFEGYHLSYVSRGYYDENLLHFWRYVPRERCHIVILERLKSDAVSELAPLAAFLGIVGFDGLPLSRRSNANWTMVHRSAFATQPGRGVADAYMSAVKLLASAMPASRQAKRQLLRSLSKPFFRESSTLRMAAELSCELINLFEPHTRNLEEILGMKLPQWRTTGRTSG
jgi:hypothetical protein